jgi:hypothetical protein
MLLVLAALTLGGSQPATVLAARDLQEALRFRSEFGLSTEIAAIEAASVERADLRYGTPLSVEEAAEMDRRVELERQLGPLGTYLDSIPEFGGWYIDQAAGHIVDLAFTVDPTPYLGEIEELIPDGMAFRTRTVQFTERELREVQARIGQDRAWLEELGIAAYEIPVNVRLNVVELGVSDAAPGITKAIAGRYGTDSVQHPVRHQ